jgi:hypothetical protein
MEKGTQREISRCLGYYREQKLSIIPIPYKSKAATIKWEEYQKRLSTDAEQESWFGTNRANVAIVCGGVSGNLVVVDCDTDSRFYELKPIIEKNLKLDSLEKHTPVVKTGKGYHIYFRTPTPVKSIKFPNLDIKGEGGYVLAPPSIHPNGEQYKFVNSTVPDIFVIASLRDIGINPEQKPTAHRDTQPNWITQALQGVGERQRNDTCTRLVGYFVTKHPQDITEMLMLAWNLKNKPPLPEKEITATTNHAYSNYRQEREEDNPLTNPIGVYNNTLFINGGDLQKIGSIRDKLTTSSRQDWGSYAKQFDEVMREAGGKIDKREVATTIGLRATDGTFWQLLNRRKQEGKVRAYMGSPNLIEWVKREYTVTQLGNVATQAMLDIKYPLRLHEYVQTPQGCIEAIVGYKSAGKTAFLLETAELNVFTQPLPVYYWYTEMSEAKLSLRCEDFPLLHKAQLEGKFIPVKQRDFQFADVLQPDGINLIDYVDRNMDYFLIGQDIQDLYNTIDRGVVIFALQKNRANPLGFGGTQSLKLSNMYITLDERQQSGKSMLGRAKIIACKDWANPEINPTGMTCDYHTLPKHGKLAIDGTWEH